jgi:PhnB protein
LTVHDAGAAVRFYRAAFDADELLRQDAPDGRVLHCELLVYGGRLLLHDEFPEMGDRSARTIGGSPVMLHLYVPDVDAAYRRAVQAGATPLMAPADAFWGDRYAQVTDPFGHRWSLATQREDLTGEEISDRYAQWRERPQ